MIELLGSGSPNVHKVIIMLEETGLPYTFRYVNVYAQEQYSPEFLRLNPNAKVPVIVDSDGPGGAPFTVIESGAILLYLAEKTGMFLPQEPRARSEVIQWLMVQMGGIGPMFGQLNHFYRYAPGVEEYSRRRYRSEARRLFDLLETRLSERAFIGGDSYSIADIAVFPWIRSVRRLFTGTFPFAGLPEPEFASLARWFAQVEERPAVARAIAVAEANPSRVAQSSGEDLDRFFNRGRFARE